MNLDNVLAQLTPTERAMVMQKAGVKEMPTSPKEFRKVEDIEAPNEESLQEYKEDKEWDCLDFAHPLELLAYIDAPIKQGVIKFHPWQVEISKLLGRKGVFTKAKPLELVIVAANGSGKDAFVNAAFAIFFCACKIRSRFIVTSSSFNQMSTQTESYIVSRAKQCNRIFQEQGAITGDLFLIKKEHITCNLSGSEIRLFVTDDPGRAEGYHPFPDHPDGELAIVLNEAKSIQDDIYNGLSRCTFTHWIEVSTPGKPSGKFYESYESAVKHPAPLVLGQQYARRVTSYDCPHISKIKIDRDIAKYGKESALVRSKHFALFTTLDEQVVITKETVDSYQSALQEKLIPKINLGLPRRAGLDLAAGGDENTLYVFENNEYIGREVFTMADTSNTARLLAEFFRKWKLSEENIFADDGGVGKGIIDNLRDHHKYSVRRVLNNSAAVNKKMYGNRGAELWFNFARIFEEKQIILPENDEKLFKQLGSRYYNQTEAQGRILLESKKKAKAKGRPSPDRADAVVLAFTGLNIQDFINPKNTRTVVKKHVSGELTSEKLAAKMQNVRWQGYSFEVPVNTTNRNFVNILRRHYGRRE